MSASRRAMDGMDDMDSVDTVDGRGEREFLRIPLPAAEGRGNLTG